MFSERREMQLKREGICTEAVKQIAHGYIEDLKEAGITIREGILVANEMGCILKEMSRCNPDSKIK